MECLFLLSFFQNASVKSLGGECEKKTAVWAGGRREGGRDGGTSRADRRMAAVLQCLGICVAYVGSVHACRRLVRPSTSSRDSRVQILARSAALVVVCFWSALVATRGLGAATLAEVLAHLGIGGRGLIYGVAYSLSTVSALLLAVVAERIGRAWRESPRGKSGPRFDLAFARNVVFAPIAEEFCFRGCMCGLLRAGGLGSAPTLVTSSLLFGVSHASGLVDVLLDDDGADLADAARQTGATIAMTAAFGLVAARVFLHTNQLAGAICAHALANWLGPPDLRRVARSLRGAASSRGARWRGGEEDGGRRVRGDDDGDEGDAASYAAATLVGLGLFCVLMWRAAPGTP